MLTIEYVYTIYISIQYISVCIDMRRVLDNIKVSPIILFSTMLVLQM